jgi:hypothetical protein
VAATPVRSTPPAPRAVPAGPARVGPDVPPQVLTTGALLDIQRHAGNQAAGELIEHATGARRRAVQRQPRRGGQPPPETTPRRIARLGTALAKRSSQAAALAELEQATDSDLDALDAAAETTKTDAARVVHRGIAFVRFFRKKALQDKDPSRKTLQPKTGAIPTGSDAGTIVKTSSGIGGGSVVIKTGGVQGDRIGYTLTYSVPTPAPPPATPGRTGTTAPPAPAATVSDAQWLQFAARRIDLHWDAKPGKPAGDMPLEARLGGRGLTSDSRFDYWLTTDAASEQWNTDTATASSPFFEDNTGTVTRTATTLEMFDPPSPEESRAREAQRSPTKPDRVVSNFHGVAYLVKGMDVIYKVDIKIAWTFAGAGKPTTTVTATGAAAKQVEGQHRVRLMQQFPDLDYLSTGAMAAPNLRSRPGSITTNLDQQPWQSNDPKERFIEVAKLADAKRIDSVWELVKSEVREAQDDKDGTAGAPGLLLMTGNVSSEGAARFVDAAGKLQGRIPATATGPLPRVALMLHSKNSLQDKAASLATLRHEMEHARHMQLAIDWLVRWRVERPGRSFANWMEDQKVDKPVKALIAHFTKGATRAPTELIAHIEGMISALPSLPAKPTMDRVRGSRFPAAITQLSDLGQSSLITDASEVRAMAIEMVVKRCCQDPPLGRALIAWIDALLKPESFTPDPANPDDAKAIVEITNVFGTGRTSTRNQKAVAAFLTDLRAAVSKPCRKKP